MKQDSVFICFRALYFRSSATFKVIVCVRLSCVTDSLARKRTDVPGHPTQESRPLHFDLQDTNLINNYQILPQQLCTCRILKLEILHQFFKMTPGCLIVRFNVIIIFFPHFFKMYFLMLSVYIPVYFPESLGCRDLKPIRPDLHPSFSRIRPMCSLCALPSERTAFSAPFFLTWR